MIKSYRVQIVESFIFEILNSQFSKTGLSRNRWKITGTTVVSYLNGVTTFIRNIS